MPLDIIELNLLFVCIAGLGGSLLGLLGFLLGPKRGWTLAGFVFALLLLGSSVAAKELQLPVTLSLALAACGGLSLLFAAVRCSWLTQSAGWFLRQAQRPRLQGLVLLAICPTLVFLWANQTDQEVLLFDEGSPAHHALDVDPSLLQVANGVQITTDRGRSLPVYQIPQEGPRSEELYQAEQDTVRSRDLAQKQIRTAPPDTNYNCHGWVFATGQFWVRGANVPDILEDNGYRAVSVPEPGDIIVYHDDRQNVLHSGLVRMVAENGLVLIESKWGFLGRYVHRPEDQCYGTLWTYYHTERGGHRLQGVGGETPQVVGVKP